MCMMFLTRTQYLLYSMAKEPFKFHPAQEQIVSDPHRFRVARCGRRFGKSWLSAYEMLARAVAIDNARIVYYAPTRDDARDIMWAILKEVCGPLIVGDPNESRLEMKVKNRHGTTSLIILYGWEALQERGKGVGVKNHFAVLDEVSKYNNFLFGWQEILRPTLMDVQGEALFISTTNGFNHFYDLCNKELEDNDYKTFHFTSYDNPHLKVEEIEKMKAEMTEDRAAQEIYADFRKKEGLVYKEFNRQVHLTDEEPDDVMYTIAGVDFGFTHPTAVPTIKKDYHGVYWITDEWFYSGKTEDEVVEYVSTQKFAKVYPDPENASAIEALKKRGVNVRSVIKGRGSVLSGIQHVRELLKQNRIRINKRCIAVIEAFEKYSYRETKGNETPDEIPAHDFSDMLDAIRYALISDDGSGSGNPTTPKVMYPTRSVRGGKITNFNKF